jgi:TolA-binding protein
MVEKPTDKELNKMAKAVKKETMNQKEMKAKIEELEEKVQEMSHRVYELNKECFGHYEGLVKWKSLAIKSSDKLEELKKALEVLGIKQVD